MNYTTKDELHELRAGDTLTLEDGTVHEAVHEERINDVCDECSLCILADDENDLFLCDRHDIACGFNNYIFKRIRP